MEITNSKPRVLLCLAAFLLASACTHMGFQRGGNAAGFEEAQSRCKAAPTEDYKSCMRKAGWFTGGQPLAPSSKSALASPMREPRPATQEVQPTRQPSEPAVERISGAGIAQRPPSIAGSPSPPADDEAMVAVGSWWKIGGSAAALKQALKACGAEPTDHTVSGTTLTCMQAKGWYAEGS